MGSLYNTIIDLCEIKGVSPSRMCLDIGVSKSVITELKAGRSKSLSAPTVEKMANYLGVTIDYLLSGGEKVDEVDSDLLETEQIFKSLPPDKQKEALRFMRYLVEHQNDQ